MHAPLRKSLNMPMLIALGAAGVLGTSWIYTAGDFFAKYGAGGEIFGLAVAGLLGTCVALAYAELAARFPRAGGEIVFACAAYGLRTTFLAGWLVSALAEDADLPPRRIAHAVVATVLIATAFYCIVLLATAWILPWQTTATFDEGAIDAFRAAGYPALAWGTYGISVLGLLTSFLALFSAASRAMPALARAGLFPTKLARLSPNGCPIPALLFTLLLTLALGWFGKGALLWFLDTGGVFIGLAWVIAVLSLYRIRLLYPQQSTSYRVRPGWLPAIGGFAALAVILATLIPGSSMSLAWTL